MSRFVIVDTPSVLPAQCKICNSPSHGPFIDTGTQEEFYGAVYYCYGCFSEMAELMQFISHTEMENIKNVVQELYNENKLLSEQVKRFKLLEDMFSDFSRRLIELNDADVASLRDSSVNANDAESEQVVVDGASELGDGTGKVNEPSDVNGLGNVQPLAGISSTGKNTSRRTVAELKL